MRMTGGKTTAVLLLGTLVANACLTVPGAPPPAFTGKKVGRDPFGLAVTGSARELESLRMQRVRLTLEDGKQLTGVVVLVEAARMQLLLEGGGIRTVPLAGIREIKRVPPARTPTFKALVVAVVGLAALVVVTGIRQLQD